MDRKLELIRAAQRIRVRAYAPFSGYLVGAAVLGGSGDIYSGCNIENVSYGATICAERVAIGNMIAAGERSIVAFAVSTADRNVPCGICRQVISEFVASGDVPIYLCDQDGDAYLMLTFGDIFPKAFQTFSTESKPE